MGAVDAFGVVVGGRARFWEGHFATIGKWSRILIGALGLEVAEVGAGWCPLVLAVMFGLSGATGQVEFGLETAAEGAYDRVNTVFGAK
jgi:hypothetical protein